MTLATIRSPQSHVIIVLCLLMQFRNQHTAFSTAAISFCQFPPIIIAMPAAMGNFLIFEEAAGLNTFLVKLVKLSLNLNNLAKLQPYFIFTTVLLSEVFKLLSGVFFCGVCQGLCICIVPLVVETATAFSMEFVKVHILHLLLNISIHNHWTKRTTNRTRFRRSSISHVANPLKHRVHFLLSGYATTFQYCFGIFITWRQRTTL